MGMATNGVPEIRSERELAAIAAKLCLASSLTAEERALTNRSNVSIVVVRAVRGLILAGDDPLGEAFLRLRSGSERRKSGAVYTPSQIVERMIDWAAEQGTPARVVDPGAGSGRFLLAAARRWPQAKLIASEIDPLVALMLRANAHVHGFSNRLTVFVGDYRDLPLRPCKGRTLFIGNPPYVRHHGIEKAWKQWFSETSRIFGFKASQLAGLHAHFFLRTRQLARRNDFGAFVTSAEWLEVNYGSVIRDMLGNGLGGSDLYLLDPSAMPFSEAMTTAAITCFRVGSHESSMTVHEVKRLSDLQGATEGRKIDWSDLRRQHRWSIIVRDGPKADADSIELGEMFRVHRGQVTGSNKVWIAGPAAAKLPAHFLIPTVTKARELIAANGELVGDKHLKRVVNLPVDLDGLDASDREAVEQFLAWARQQNVESGFVAKHRRAWWAVGLRDAAPVLCTYMARRPPVFVRNRCGARHLNIAHGLYPREPMDDELLGQILAFLSSNICQSAGRTYAGGLTKFEPGEVARLRIPSAQRLAEVTAP